MREVTRFDADDFAIDHFEEHPTLHATETTVRRHERLGYARSLTPTCRWFPSGLKIVVEIALWLKEILID